MESTQGAPAADAAGTVTADQNEARKQAKRARKKAEFDAAVAAAIADHDKAVNARLSAIFASDKIKGRETAALQLAMASPAMSAEQVIAIVAGLPAGAAHASISERLGGAGVALSLGAPAEAAAAQPTRNRVVERINARRGFKAA